MRHNANDNAFSELHQPEKDATAFGGAADSTRFLANVRKRKLYRQVSGTEVPWSRGTVYGFGFWGMD